jgi:tryptophan-rich sensory protein
MNTPLRTIPSRINPWVALLGWFAACAAAGAIGSIASVNAGEFYATLDKPRWAPPAAVFGPVWTALYALMAVAAWVVWRERSWARARTALGLFVVQLLVNALWSWLFFAWRRGGLAFVDIVVLLALLVATMITFARIRKLAAWLLAPYLLWVCFAAVLNWTVWQQNPRLL